MLILVPQRRLLPSFFSSLVPVSNYLEFNFVCFLFTALYLCLSMIFFLNLKFCENLFSNEIQTHLHSLRHIFHDEKLMYWQGCV